MTAQEEIERILTIAEGRIAFIKALGERAEMSAECARMNVEWNNLLCYGLSPFTIKEMAEAWLERNAKQAKATS